MRAHVAYDDDLEMCKCSRLGNKPAGALNAEHVGLGMYGCTRSKEVHEHCVLSALSYCAVKAPYIKSDEQQASAVRSSGRHCGRG